MPSTIATFVIAAALTGQAPASTPAVDDILRGYYEALGGLDKIQAVDSVRIRGTRTERSEATPYTWLFRRPGHLRFEFSFQGRPHVQATDGQTSWMIFPFGGSSRPQKMPAEIAKEFMEQAEFPSPLAEARARGHRVELVGKEEVNGTPTYKLKLTLPSGEQYYYLDAKSFLPVKTIVTTQGLAEIETFYEDYAKVGGIALARSSRWEMRSLMEDGTSQTVTMHADEIQLGVDLPDAQFLFPAPAAR